MSTSKHLRVHVVAIATAAALGAVAAPAAAAPPAVGRAHTANLKSNETYSQFIVKYRDGSTARTSSSAMASSLQGAAGRALPALAGGKGKKLGLKHYRRMALGADVVRADRGLDRVEAEALMHQIAADPNVEYVQPDTIMRATLQPNDTRYADQWHYATSATGANVSTAWDTSTGEGVVVAVVDSGIIAHTDLSANILPGYDMLASVEPFTQAQCAGVGAARYCGGSGDGNGRDNNPNDASGVEHGTHVAGTVAAVTNNNAGVAGVAYGARVVPVRVLGNEGFGPTSDIVDGIIWASGGAVDGVPANANPAEVINLSLGGEGDCDPAYQDAINTAVANGSVVVVAAGNDNFNVSRASPANCANTVTVAASDRGGRRAFYSNYGATIDITAPGGETCTPDTEFLALEAAPSCTRNTLANGVLSTVSGNGYDYYQGTSMAAPHVAGIVALMQSVAAQPKTTAQVLQILRDTARPIAAANCPGGCGPGLIDASAAVVSASGGVEIGRAHV